MNYSKDLSVNKTRTQDPKAPYQRHFLRQRHLERRMRKSSNRLICKGSAFHSPCIWEETHVISIVHGHGHTLANEIVNVQCSLLRPVGRSVHHLELSRTRCDEICGPVLREHQHTSNCHKRGREAGHGYALEMNIIYLVSERMSSNDDRFDPSRNRLRDTRQDDRFAEDCASKDIADLTQEFKILLCSSMV